MSIMGLFAIVLFIGSIAFITWVMIAPTGDEDNEAMQDGVIDELLDDDSSD